MVIPRMNWLQTTKIL